MVPEPRRLQPSGLEVEAVQGRRLGGRKRDGVKDEPQNAQIRLLDVEVKEPEPGGQLGREMGESVVVKGGDRKGA